MADNYLEKQMEQYQARKAAWERKRKSGKKKKLPTLSMLHRFSVPTAGIPLPEKFTYPFCYTPHPLCVLAAEEVKKYLSARYEWAEELQAGKMFGVLVVLDTRNEIGYLAAYSGILAGRNDHPFFVPPVYDLLNPEGFFKTEEAEITRINGQIRLLENDAAYRTLQEQAAMLQQAREAALQQARLERKAAKIRRDVRRSCGNLSAEEQASLLRESQFQKAEYKRLEQAWEEKIRPIRAQLAAYEERIHALKAERKRRSAALQEKLFGQFKMLNQRGEARDLCDIFSHTVHQTPPAGAGECAAPKLLQQAYLHHWKPLAMAEFWWGNSPRTEIRQHGHYYPACKGKCGPILEHMLQGLDVEDNPLLHQTRAVARQSIGTVYEDKWMTIVCKPAGMLSVPGKEEAPSVYSLMRERYPEADGPLIVHRLDMATSGLILIARNKQVHQALQALFHHRQIKKRYIALLDGTVEQAEGIIDLPLCSNPLDRPRQMVDEQHGKPALTRYTVLERTGAYTRVAFYPQTGRTHQLRVHAAHPQGLNCPIVGDELYGKKAERLFLHAEMLEFLHPVTRERLRIECPAPF